MPIIAAFIDELGALQQKVDNIYMQVPKSVNHRWLINQTVKAMKLQEQHFTAATTTIVVHDDAKNDFDSLQYEVIRDVSGAIVKQLAQLGERRLLYIIAGSVAVKQVTEMVAPSA